MNEMSISAGRTRPGAAASATPSQSRPGPRVAVLGGGHGVAAVLEALRDECGELTAIVTVADDGGSSGELRRRREGPAVGDLRRSLIALAGHRAPLARAFPWPLEINRLGTHPLGNLVISSLAAGFGDLGMASAWLGEQLGVRGRVLPATSEPVSLVAETDQGLVRGESAIGESSAAIRRLRFEPANPKVPSEALQAIAGSDWVLLGPGSLFTSVLAASAVPGVAAALAATQARIVWIANLSRQRCETAGMSALDHLHALCRHHIRADLVLYDPRAELSFAPEQLRKEAIEGLPRSVASPHPGAHDPHRLRTALRELFGQGKAALGGVER